MVAEPDVLSSTLAALRVSGSVVLHHDYVAPWSITVPSSAELAALVDARPDDRVVAFHATERGQLDLVAGSDRVALGPGELVVCFGGVPHRMSRGRGATDVPLAAIFSGRVDMPKATPGPDVTRLVCGVFVLRDPWLNPLLAALPPLLHAPLFEGALEPWTRLLVRELGGGPGAAFLVERTLEVLCASLIRAYAAEAPDLEPGFFRVLGDARICRAVEAVHRAPAAPWSVASLARQAGLSRSRFASRFAELAGVGPMTYVLKWRMNLAARALRGTDSVAEVAERVGYDSVPAFSRAFKRCLGVAPAHFRASLSTGRSDANAPRI